MAFYTSRVDDNGNELERRLSGRSNRSTSSNGSCLLSSSSRSSSMHSSRVSRYVNSAAFIESTDNSDSSILDGDSDFECQSQDNLVPPLDIQSNEENTSNRKYTFSYRKHYDPSLVVDPQVAYNTWLSAKRKVKSDEAAKKKAMEEAKKEAEEQRKLQAREEYEKWLQKKTQQQNQMTKEVSNMNLPSSTTSSSKNSNRQRYYRECEAQARHEQWEHRKRIQEEKKRAQKLLEQQQKKKEEELRRQRAEEAWQKWNSTAASKPKPVPLNRGFFSLKGTVSNIFVNPNEWQS